MRTITLCAFVSAALLAAAIPSATQAGGAAPGARTRPHRRPATQAAASQPATTKPVLSYAGVRLEKDVEFLGPGRTERLDLYLPASVKPNERFPGIVIIHGGGWLSGDKFASREQNIGTTLVRAGYVCASINYALASEGHPTWPRNVQDCKTAVQFLRKYAERYHVDPDHIGVIGGSAGGHLAAMLALVGPQDGLEPPGPYAGISSRVQAAVVMYGITDLLTRKRTKPDGTPIDESLADGGSPTMLGAGRTENPRLWAAASPVSHVTRDDPPVFILHGTADATVDYNQAVELDKKLRATGVESQLLLIPGAKHSFDLQPPQEDLRPLVVGFFDRHLKH